MSENKLIGWFLSLGPGRFLIFDSTFTEVIDTNVELVYKRVVREAAQLKANTQFTEEELANFIKM